MSFIFLALLAHLGNAVVFAVDKGLLNAKTAISKPVDLAFYTCLFSGASIVLLPFFYQAPTLFLWQWSFISAALFVVALLFFFFALERGESSRVAPLIGSIVPIVTLLFGVLLLKEQLQLRELLAVALLIIGGALLSLRFSKLSGLSGWTIMLTLLGGIAFAAHFSAIKHLYSGYDYFFTAFIYSRVAVGVVALLVLAPLILQKRKTKRKETTKKARQRTKKAFIHFLSSKIVSSTAFIVQNYAISLGSVTIVNALQGTQYVFLLLLVALLSRRVPSLFQEDFQRIAFIQKSVGIGVISIGLALLV